MNCSTGAEPGCREDSEVCKRLEAHGEATSGRSLVARLVTRQIAETGGEASRGEHEVELETRESERDDGRDVIFTGIHCRIRNTVKLREKINKGRNIWIIQLGLEYTTSIL
jgi:hypothetical protein